MMLLSKLESFCGLILVLHFTGYTYGRSVGSSNSGSTTYNYRAKRFGNYYSTTFFSYSGGVGHARYSRVYSTKKNLYEDHYFQLFDWFKTKDYVIYSNTPSNRISVCKNYEADSNGTYLGIFTCPLPIFPKGNLYCCGEKNAEYCCTFWDVPMNVIAASVVALMGAVILFTLCYTIYLLQKTKHTQKMVVKRKKSIFRKKNLHEMVLREMHLRMSYRAWTNSDLFRSTSDFDTENST